MTNLLAGIFDDNFIDYLFDLVEQTRHMQDETLNYSLIKLIVSLGAIVLGCVCVLTVTQVALNEQFMVATMSSSPSNTTASQNLKQSSDEDNNRVLRILMRRLNSSKTFGENMIFMLNRAGEHFCVRLACLSISSPSKVALLKTCACNFSF